jgi:hypothetical protein
MDSRSPGRAEAADASSAVQPEVPGSNTARTDPLVISIAAARPRTVRSRQREELCSLGGGGGGGGGELSCGASARRDFPPGSSPARSPTKNSARTGCRPTITAARRRSRCAARVLHRAQSSRRPASAFLHPCVDLASMRVPCSCRAARLHARRIASNCGKPALRPPTPPPPQLRSRPALRWNRAAIRLVECRRAFPSVRRCPGRSRCCGRCSASAPVPRTIGVRSRARTFSSAADDEAAMGRLRLGPAPGPSGRVGAITSCECAAFAEFLAELDRR